jgi:hypothetical protein
MFPMLALICGDSGNIPSFDFIFQFRSITIGVPQSGISGHHNSSSGE